MSCRIDEVTCWALTIANKSAIKELNSLSRSDGKRSDGVTNNALVQKSLLRMGGCGGGNIRSRIQVRN